MPRKDPVTPELRHDVMWRDAREVWDALEKAGLSYQQIKAVLRAKPLCVAPLLDPPASATCSGTSTLDHVKDQPMMGKRAPSDMDHLVTLCENHHLWTGWATSHRPELREYLKGANERWETYQRVWKEWRASIGSIS